jgi:hypothetical protein
MKVFINKILIGILFILFIIFCITNAGYLSISISFLSCIFILLYSILVNHILDVPQIVHKNFHVPYLQRLYLITRGFFILKASKITWKKTICFTEIPEYSIYAESCVNKIGGISLGYHRKNSLRWGFGNKNIDGVISMYSYIYNNGKILITKIGEIKPCTKIYLYIEHDFELNLSTFTALDSFDNVLIRRSYLLIYKSMVGYELGIYIGGDDPAKNKYEIIIS